MGNEQIKCQQVQDKEIKEDMQKIEQGDSKTELKQSIIDEQVRHYNLELDKEFKVRSDVAINLSQQRDHRISQGRKFQMPRYSDEQSQNQEVLLESKQKMQVTNKYQQIAQHKEKFIEQEKIILKTQPNSLKIENSQKQFTNIQINPQKSRQSNQFDKKQPLLIEKGSIDHRQQPNQQFVITQILDITTYSRQSKNLTISLNQNTSIATQNKHYYENQKLIITNAIEVPRARALFKVVNLKYCIGMGICLKEVIEKHNYNYQSYQNELSHGLYLVTSQGFSWSHSYKNEDDIKREGFSEIKNGDTIEVLLDYSQLTFTIKQYCFTLELPESIRKKYTICFCAYLHQLSDSLALMQV